MSQTSTLTSNGLHMNIFFAYHNLNDIRFLEEHDILVRDEANRQNEYKNDFKSFNFQLQYQPPNFSYQCVGPRNQTIGSMKEIILVWGFYISKSQLYLHTCICLDISNFTFVSKGVFVQIYPTSHLSPLYVVTNKLMYPI